MKFEDVTYTGPAFDDAELLNELPPELAAFLLEENGFVAVRGGFHVRGACREPAWHSLRAAWLGPESVSSRYPSVRSSDVPFAEDAVGDQFLVREGIVHRLSGETGEIESLGATLTEFLSRVANDPIEYLSLGPLLAFEDTGNQLAPGQLLNVYPPYCVDTPTERSFRAVPAEQQLRSLARLAEEIRDLPDGTQIKIVPKAV
jgi:hypothetical protein